MGKFEKLLIKILGGSSDNNIKFEDLRRLLGKLGFEERIKGSHHIYFKEGIEEIINIQAKNGMAKPYQVKQVRNIVADYKIELNDEKK